MPSIQKVPFADRKEFRGTVMIWKSAIDNYLEAKAKALTKSELKELKLLVVTGLNTLKDVVTRSNRKQLSKLNTIIIRVYEIATEDEDDEIRNEAISLLVIHNKAKKEYEKA